MAVLVCPGGLIYFEVQGTAAFWAQFGIDKSVVDWGGGGNAVPLLFLPLPPAWSLWRHWASCNIWRRLCNF
ncbi:MAG: hypothetical protein M5U34_36375 [Chloroflexi bacterium]|nr:hypothetical protein [Chloroflexota bacterium]